MSTISFGVDGLAQAVPVRREMSVKYRPFDRRRGIACIGSFEHPPNVEAVAYLCGEILPLVEPTVLQLHPIYIIGNKPTEAVREFARGRDHVHVIGWVSSVTRCPTGACVVVPLLYGAGTKRKLVQALAAGTPTVSTSIGTEGLSLVHGEDVLVADEPDQFAEYITTLLEDSELWSRLARGGRHQMRQTNGKKVARRLFLAALDNAILRTPKQPPALPRRTAQDRVIADEYEKLVDSLREKVPSLIPEARMSSRRQ